MKTLPGRLSILAILILGGCSTTTPEQLRIVSEAGAIQRFPVNRSTLIKDLGLTSLPSKPLNNGVRGGRAWFTESWILPSGLTLIAFATKYVGNDTLTRASIDAILNNPDRTRHQRVSGDFIHPLSAQAPQRSFERIILVNSAGKILFDSNAPKR